MVRNYFRLIHVLYTSHLLVLLELIIGAGGNPEGYEFVSGVTVIFWLSMFLIILKTLNVPKTDYNLSEVRTKMSLEL